MNMLFITAPYQMLSALEVVHQMDLKEPHLAIIDTGHFTRSQFDCVIDPDQWESVKYHSFPYRFPHRDFGKNRPETLKEYLLEKLLLVEQAINRLRINRIARRIGVVDTLVLGNYRRDYDGHMRHLANRLSFQNLVVLDIGTDTLRINHDRHLDQRNCTADDAPEQGLLQRCKEWVKSRWIYWDTRGVSSITFFSSYDLELAEGDRLIRNSYRYLQDIVSKVPPSKEVFFVGQPLVDQFYVESGYYASALAFVREYFRDQKLIYVQHPRESREQLEIVRNLNIPVRKFSAPFEYTVSIGGHRPEGVASFFSSVLENCATIFGASVKVFAFKLPQEELLKDHDEVTQVYNQLAESHRATMNFIDVPALASHK